jgi:hypothetical protein
MRLVADFPKWRAGSGQVGFVVDKAATREVFFRVLRFPLPSIPLTAPHSSSPVIIWGWYSRPVVASVTVDSVPLHWKRKTKPSKQVKLYYSGLQSQQNFLLLSPSTDSLHVSARVGHLQVNIFFEASYCLLTDPLFGLSLHILSLIINRYV